MTALPDPAVPLTEAAARDAFSAMLDGSVDNADIAAFLVTLADRGETADEIAAAAAVLRDRMTAVTAPGDAIDVCGTGGDGSHSFNISTAVAFVVAAAGVPVAKHGNRGASSLCGTADVLEALGWTGDLPFGRVEACLNMVGVTFLFAQRHHPAMARVAPVRRALGRRTIFNLLGPLANPARVTRQMLGVFSPRWFDPMAEAGCAMGSTDMLLVHGSGLDELALHGPSDLVWMRDGRRHPAQLLPEALGLDVRPFELLRGGAPAENAAALRAILEGRIDRPALAAYRDIVRLNAAAALKMARRVQGWQAGLALADDMLASGAAADKLARFIAFR